jgi:hybrid cluster-associated redox disulfide protein
MKHIIDKIKSRRINYFDEKNYNRLSYDTTKITEPRKQNPNLITREMLLGNVIKYSPETINIMMDHGINCFACHISSKHTLENAASFDNVDVSKLMYELNQRSVTWR